MGETNGKGPGDPYAEPRLLREISGEILVWAGWSSGTEERAIGRIGILFGIFMVLLGSGCGGDLYHAVAGFPREWPPPAMNVVNVLMAVLCLAFLVGGGFWMTAFSWRLLRSAGRVLWAVTDRRLLRLFAVPSGPVHSWTGAEIADIRRGKYRGAEALRITLVNRRVVQWIEGPDDLDGAEQAILDLPEARTGPSRGRNEGRTE